MTSTAASSGESDGSSRVDSQTIILVLDNCTRDGHTSGGSDIESISVVASVCNISSCVIEVDVVDCECGSTVDRHELNRGVLEVESSDG